MYCYSPVFNRAASNLQPCLHWDKTSVASSNVRLETSLGKLILLRKTMRMQISGLSAVLTEWQHNPISKKFSFSIWLLLHLENNNSHEPALLFVWCFVLSNRPNAVEASHAAFKDVFILRMSSSNRAQREQGQVSFCQQRTRVLVMHYTDTCSNYKLLFLGQHHHLQTQSDQPSHSDYSGEVRR